MIEPNNPEIDTERLRQRLAHDMEQAQHRPYRIHPAPRSPSAAPSAWQLIHKVFDLPWVGPRLRHITRRIRGARLKERLRERPLLGPVLRWGWAILHVVRLRDDLLRTQGRLEDLNAQLQSHLSLQRQAIATLEQGMTALERRLTEKLTDKADLDELRRLRREVIHLQHAAPAAPKTVETPAPSPDTGDLPSDFYLDFEDRFRGAFEAIQARQAKYLPLIREAQAGTPSHPVLDLGCGRGEWLDLLRREGLEAQGVDSNDRMLAACRELGLNVHHADALAYLRSLEDDALGAITGFHIAEHLPFNTLIALFDEAWRVLKPGGLLLLETPNPENLQVGAHTFYMDPTHRHPLPPALLEFLAQARGYTHVEIQRHHPYPLWDPTQAENEAQATLQRLIFGPQDYALIARKP